MRILLYCLLSVVLFFALQPQMGNCAVINGAPNFPATVGSSWNFNTQTLTPTASGQTLMWGTETVQVHPSGSFHSVITLPNGNMVTSDNYYVNVGQSIHINNTQITIKTVDILQVPPAAYWTETTTLNTYSPTQVAFPASITQGTSETTTSTANTHITGVSHYTAPIAIDQPMTPTDNVTTQVVDLTVGAPESITVPAGTFQAVKITKILNITEGTTIYLPYIISEWYAPGVGLVKMTSPNMNRELVSYNVIAPPTPTISSFTPTTGQPGITNVTINGSNFGASANVCFQGSNACATPTSISASQITVRIPCNAQSGTFTVTTNGLTTTSAASFTVQPAALPTISNVTPTSGYRNDLITITGTNFSTCQTVRFNGVNATASSISNDGTTIMTNVPAGASSGPITINSVSGGNFTVYPNPIVSGVINRSGPDGTQVTVNGTFVDMAIIQGATRYVVLVDGVAAKLDSISASSLKFTIPTIGNKSSYSMSLTYNYQTSYDLGTFTVTPKLTATYQGDGSGSLNSTPSGINCTSSACPSANFSFGSSVSVIASPNQFSSFNGWSGCNSISTTNTAGDTCHMAMNANHTASVIFNLLPARVFILGSQAPYQTIQSAYNAAIDDDVIQPLAVSYAESPLTFGHTVKVTLAGGYDSFFLNQTGFTTVQGQVIFKYGSVTVDRLAIQ